MTADLHAAVDDLTRPTLHKGVTRLARLPQLRAAVAASSNTGGGKALPNQRIPLDPRALETFERMRGHILAEYRRCGGRKHHERIEDTLRAWYVLIYPHATDPYREDWTARLAAWAHDIDRILDPPRTLELIDTPCILCGHAEAVNGDGDLQAAIVIEYRRTPEELVSDVRAMCRACRAVWEGKHGAESFMRYAEEQAEQAQPYEMAVPATRGLKYDGALNIAREAFETAGIVHGRIHLTGTPSIADPRWLFTADLRDTPAEEDAAFTASG